MNPIDGVSAQNIAILATAVATIIGAIGVIWKSRNDNEAAQNNVASAATGTALTALQQAVTTYLTELNRSEAKLATMEKNATAHLAEIEKRLQACRTDLDHARNEIDAMRTENAHLVAELRRVRLLLETEQATNVALTRRVNELETQKVAQRVDDIEGQHVSERVDALETVHDPLPPAHNPADHSHPPAET